MINPLNLEGAQSEHLSRLQDSINRHAEYAEQVAHAKSSWKNKPTALFDELKVHLASMCSGNRRCVYCEDSMADEIEHMRPKDLFPEQVYAWNNYILACGPCNGPKNNKFAVLGDPLALIDITRKPKAPVLPPETGRHALVDPRVEDPVRFLWLDFRTWRYVPNTDDETSDIWVRAEYTIDVLRLNKRDDLVRGRKSAVTGYESRIRTWIDKRNDWSDEQRQSYIDDFKSERYRGVWERMKRYRSEIQILSPLNLLIETAPEVLNW